ncbi:Gfo/Idh/MocA family oxidoreductase [Thermatribacter velox]|uniref:Gfo/Idh/MocA family oxidoreductase n=1 Tax=Thermatribacter velox TaxID=3039681 RepID=A0ABZ2YAG0_9BACT
MRKIGFGIIGAGIWGETHAKIYASHHLSELIAVCDTVEEKARSLALKYGAKNYYTDFEKMLENSEIQAVAITTPDFAHREPFIAALKAGKHVIVEKPLATTNEDLQAMKEAYDNSDCRVMVDFHARFSPPFAIAKESIQKGELGKVISMYYRLNDIIYVPTQMLSWTSKSSVLWFLGSHTIDTLRFLIDSEVQRVYSVSRSEVLIKKNIPVADIYQSILEFENGTIATIENNWIVPNTNPHWNDIKLNILGSKGMINMDLTNNQAFERYLESKSDHPDILVMPTIHGKPMGFAHESIRDFIERLADGREFLATFEDGYRVSKVILALMDSAEERLPKEVKYD